MRWSPHDFDATRVDVPPGEFVLEHELVIELPAGWNHVSGGGRQTPPIDGVTSFIELADDEVVVTVLTRDYGHDPDRLLEEVTGAHPSDDSNTNYSDLDLRKNVRGRALCERDEFEELFIAALVVEARLYEPTARIGVEVVAAGPVGAITERLPLLRSMVSSIGHR